MSYISPDIYGAYSKFLNNQLLYPQINTLLPRVSSTKEVDDFPVTSLNSEEVYLNKEDDTVMYIKRVDANGKCVTTRYRFYPDPEPTQQQINDERYVTMDQFNKLKEHKHASNFYQMFNEYCSKMSNSLNDLPEYVKETRKEVVDMYSECTAKIKIMWELIKA